MKVLCVKRSADGALRGFDSFGNPHDLSANLRVSVGDVVWEHNGRQWSEREEMRKAARNFRGVSWGGRA